MHDDVDATRRAPAARADDNGAMATTETRLTRAAIALSVLLVLVLGALATYSVLGNDGGGAGTTVDPVPDDDPAYPGPHLEVDDRELPLQVGCVPSAEAESGYAILMVNLAGLTVDYVVSVALVDEEGGSVWSTAVLPALAPDEERQVEVPDREVSGRVVDCTITAVQTDRRLLLANS